MISKQQKEMIIELYLSGKYYVKEICLMTGVSHTAFYKTIRDYQNEKNKKYALFRKEVLGNESK